MTFHFNNFTIDDLPERARFTVIEVNGIVQSPFPLIFASMLSTLATACQGAFDVELPTGTMVPPSLIIFTIAESGERKTSTDNIFLAPIHAAQQRFEEQRALIVTEHEGKLAVWSVKRKTLEAQLKKALVGGGGSDEETLALTAHLSARPVLPRTPHFMYSDTTIEALLKNLSSVWPQAALISSEGSTVVNGRAMQQLAPINELWDGAKLIRVDRKTTESFSIRDARLTVSLMLQRGPFDQFLRRNDSAAWDTGLLARALVAEPWSNQGMRQVQAASTSAPMPKHLHEFHARVTQALEASVAVGMGQRQRKVLRFNPEAKLKWLDFAHWVERNLSPGQQFASVKGYASKLPNNMARIAALLHYLESDEEEISLATTKAAAELCNYYSIEYLRLFGVKDQKSMIEEYASMLDGYLNSQKAKNGGAQFYISDLYKCAPTKIRRRDVMNQAIGMLSTAGKIFVYRHCKPSYIVLNPNYSNGI